MTLGVGRPHGACAVQAPPQEPHLFIPRAAITGLPEVCKQTRGGGRHLEAACWFIPLPSPLPPPSPINLNSTCFLARGSPQAKESMKVRSYSGGSLSRPWICPEYQGPRLCRAVWTSRAMPSTWAAALFLWRSPFLEEEVSALGSLYQKGLCRKQLGRAGT